MNAHQQHRASGYDDDSYHSPVNVQPAYSGCAAIHLDAVAAASALFQIGPTQTTAEEEGLAKGAPSINLAKLVPRSDHLQKQSIHKHEDIPCPSSACGAIYRSAPFAFPAPTRVLWSSL